MIETELYILMKQTAIDANYTSEAMGNVTYRQARNVLGQSFAISFFRTMKRAVVNYLSRLEAQTWLETNYPNVESDIETERGKTKVTVWPDGRPDA